MNLRLPTDIPPKEFSKYKLYLLNIVLDSRGEFYDSPLEKV
ncbi:hypothetical protein LEP1GSC193_3478 [Leptospira alstonii serovar Pingchang str. 80-412]|uniref:Uncharacterized protein n=2 Tax=Leptospira alstonii TaxID=28452 RepID=M6CR11_9LEPT|nr:hypothetical protein LEP1GSC194_2280 [Leptospira alstonii serovar Sichuan str. 79601]EQA81977.1 hypothetical protein LEP1GSC193_3478 [Leptospira alstonii serovar Pingchang str. 80-412]